MLARHHVRPDKRGKYHCAIRPRRIHCRICWAVLKDNDLNSLGEPAVSISRAAVNDGYGATDPICRRCSLLDAASSWLELRQLIRRAVDSRRKARNARSTRGQRTKRA
jgi:hypothetical protein